MEIQKTAEQYRAEQEARNAAFRETFNKPKEPEAPQDRGESQIRGTLEASVREWVAGQQGEDQNLERDAQVRNLQKMVENLSEQVEKLTNMQNGGVPNPAADEEGPKEHMDAAVISAAEDAAIAEVDGVTTSDGGGVNADPPLYVSDDMVAAPAQPFQIMVDYETTPPTVFIRHGGFYDAENFTGTDGTNSFELYTGGIDSFASAGQSIWAILDKSSAEWSASFSTVKSTDDDTLSVLIGKVSSSGGVRQEVIGHISVGGGGAGMPWNQIRFGWAGVFYDEAANVNVFRVYKGAIRINNDTYTLPVDPVGQGADPVDYATKEILLMTDYIVVYAGCTVVAGEDGNAFIDAHPMDLPDMWTDPIIQIPLYTLEKYTVDPPEGAAGEYLTTRWRLYRIHNLGDIMFSGLVVPPPNIEPAVLVWQDGSMRWVSASDNFSVLQKQDDELVFDWTRQL